MVDARPCYVFVVLRRTLEIVGLVGTLKTRDWKTWDQIAGVEKTGLENTGPISWVENARPPSIEREMDKYKVERNINDMYIIL